MEHESALTWVLATYPERVDALFDALDLERDGLQAVQAAAALGDTAGAWRALLDSYRTGASGHWLRGPTIQSGNGRDEGVEKLVDGIFTDYGWEYRYRLADGRID